MKRWAEAGDVRYLTFSCHRQLPLLKHQGIKDVFRDELAERTASDDIRLIAWVVMHDHVHLILQPIDDDTIVPLLAQLKRNVARTVLSRWRTLDAPILKKLETKTGRTKFWKPGGGYDRVLVNDADIVEKIDYIHANPVEKGYCDFETDWPWSSARAYAGLPNDGPPIEHAM